MRRGVRSGLFTMVAVHSSVRGPALGGCRMWHYDDARAAMRDVLRLSRAMTYKSAVAGLPLGGGKGIILAPNPAVARPPRPARRRAARLRRHRRRRSAARTSRPRTSARRRATWRSSRRSRRTSAGCRAGAAARATRARGRRSASRRRSACAASASSDRRRWHGRTIVDRRPRPRRRARREALRERRRDAARHRHRPLQARARRRPRRALGRAGARRSAARPTSSSRARSAASSTTTASRCSARRSSPAPRTTSSPTTRSPSCSTAHGVLWAPDFVVNAGGIINISVELEPGGYDPRRARVRVRGIGDTLRRIFDDAQATRRVAAVRRDGARPRAPRRSGGAPRDRARRRPDGGQTTGRRPPGGGHCGRRTSGRQAALLVELAEVRGERRRRGQAQARGRVVPDAVEQLVGVAQAVVERREQAPLAVAAVREVAIQQRGGIGHRRAVAGAQQREVHRAQALERGEVAAQRARVGGDEDAALRRAPRRR